MNNGKILFDEWCSDDTLTLFDYFKEKSATDYNLKTILTDLHLFDKLGQDQIHDGADLFYTTVMPDGRQLTSDFDIAIDVVIDLSAILLETFRKGKITLKDLYKYEREDYPAFTIHVDKDDLDLLLNELKAFTTNPTHYNLAEMMSTDELMELAADCRNVYEEIQCLKQ